MLNADFHSKVASPGLVSLCLCTIICLKFIIFWFCGAFCPKRHHFQSKPHAATRHLSLHFGTLGGCLGETTHAQPLSLGKQCGFHQTRTTYCLSSETTGTNEHVPSPRPTKSPSKGKVSKLHTIPLFLFSSVMNCKGKPKEVNHI